MRMLSTRIITASARLLMLAWRRATMLTIATFAAAILCFRFVLRLIAGHANRLTNQSLDCFQILTFIGVHEGNRVSLGASASGPTDAVHVRLRFVREVIVEYVRDIVHV